MSIPRTELESSPLFSETLDIDLKSGKDSELFKWFLASLLFGARISETIAERTYRSFARHRLLDPQSILNAGWNFLVNPVMREGGYVRYDNVASNKILKACQRLLEDYGGSLNRLHENARDSRDLEASLLDFYGVGPVTANIFLRELRPYWSKADPDPLPRVWQAAQKKGVDLRALPRKALAFARLEAGLIRQRQ